MTGEEELALNHFCSEVKDEATEDQEAQAWQRN